jgi:hypothetical protein
MSGCQWLVASRFVTNLILGLRLRVRAVKEKSHDLFEDFSANVDCAVDAIGRFHPIDFADSDVPLLRFFPVTELDIQQVAAHDDCHTMKRIAMPRGGLSRAQPLAADQVISAMMQHLLSSEAVHSGFFKVL